MERFSVIDIVIVPPKNKRSAQIRYKRLKEYLMKISN
jgi:hypothetical protein